MINKDYICSCFRKI